MSSPAQRLGDYEIIDVLGAGGMGRVYRVRNVLTDRVEAMKVLLPNLQGHEEVAARFLREIKVLANLEHRNIAALRTALTIENQLVMVMEYVEGESISARLNIGAIPVPLALSYLDQVLEALSYAHARHIIHRDIKPANMMVTRQGVVKLMDFGIAHTEGDVKKLTATGSTLGSISYMSPEQVRGEATDERSDLYSLGISLYEMVTGKKPFDEGSSFSIMAAHINLAPRPPIELQPGVPPMVNDLILTAIAKRREDRFQSAEAFRRAVQQARALVGPAVPEDRTMIQGSVEYPAPPIANDGTMVQGSSQNTVANTPTINPAVIPTAPRTAINAPAHVPTAPAPAYVPPPYAAAPAPAYAPPQQPGYAPPPQAGGNRGIYVALGALLVVAMLVGAGLYLPSHRKASADTEAPRPVVQETPAPPPAPVVTATPAPAPVAQVPVAPPVKKVASAPPVPAGPPPGLDEVEHEIDQLTTRAASVNNTINNMQRQQAAAGYGLRGDIVEAQASLNISLAKAQDALRHEDVGRAKRYAAQASGNLETLERFVGR